MLSGSADTLTGAAAANGRLPVQATLSPARARRFRPSPHPLSNRLARGLWGIVWLLLFRPSPRLLRGWRRFLLRMFGGRLGKGAVVHASTRIWAPWNLRMGPYSCLSEHVDCYDVAPIRIGAFATVSKYSFLCTASHDPDSPDMTLITAPIVIGAHAWVAAGAFVAQGVEIGEGAVLGARSSAFADVPPWTIAVGLPARPIRARSRAVAEFRQARGRP